MSTHPAEPHSALAQLQSLGSANSMVDVLFRSLGHSKFFEDFTRENIITLSQFMHVFRAEPGQVIIWFVKKTYILKHLQDLFRFTSKLAQGRAVGHQQVR
jgi:hypothetical protein